MFKKFSGKFTGRVRFGLQLKSVLLVTTIVLVVAATLSLFFTSRQKQQSLEDLRVRGLSIAKTLAYNSEYGVLVSNSESLNKLIGGLKDEVDIAYVAIHDMSGNLLASSGDETTRSRVDKILSQETLESEDIIVNDIALEDTGEEILEISVPIMTAAAESDPFLTEDTEEKQQENKIGVARIGMTYWNMNRKIQQVRHITFILTLGIIILSSIITNFLVKNLLMKTIRDLLEAAKAVGQGDLKSVINVVSNDELGQLSIAFREMQINLSTLAEQAALIAAGDLREVIGFEGDLAEGFNQMSENLRTLARQIDNAAQKLDTYSNDILSSAEEQSSSATQLASSTAEVSATIEELSAAAKQISDNADLVAKMAENSLNSAQVGRQAVAKAFIGTEAIKTATQESAKRISTLGHRSQKISEVIDIISKISEQTKLLSLNASIEAARAGEAGKGFSVVAGEIRRLSESTAESVREVREIIKEIQSSINISVMSSEKMEETVDQGLVLSQKVGDALEEILDTVEKTVDYSKQIRHSTQQQKTASEQVSVTVKEMASGSKQAADVSYETASTARKVTELSAELKVAISKLQYE